MSQKNNTSKKSNSSPSLSLVYSSVTPLVQSTLKFKLCCPWHKEHIRFISANSFFDFKNDILTGGFSCVHASCRVRTFNYIVSYLGCRQYKTDGGVV